METIAANSSAHVHDLAEASCFPRHRETCLQKRIQQAHTISALHGWHQASDNWKELKQLIENLPEHPIFFDLPDFSVDRNSADQLASWFLALIKDFRISTRSNDSYRMFNSEDSIDTALADSVRTRRFANEITSSTCELIQKFGSVHVVDAGCGMIPLLGVVAALQSQSVNVTFLESNPDSAFFAAQIIDALGVADRCRVINCDATSFEPLPPCHLLISETMFTGLTNEPFVQIMEHLAPGLLNGGRIIPASVTVKIGLVPLDEGDVKYTVLGAHNQIIRATEPVWLDQMEYKSGDTLEKIEFSIPLAELGEIDQTYKLVVASDVFLGNEKLSGMDSLLTLPRPVLSNNDRPLFLAPQFEPNEIISVRYKPGENPRGQILF